MNYTQSQPTGEDAYVNDLQVGMYANLPVRLGLDASKWNCFSRVYRNNITDEARISGYIPEAYYNGQYIAGNGASNRGGLFFESGFVVSFFGETQKPMERKDSGYNCWHTELIFFIDLSIIAPFGIDNPTTQRIDETVINIIKNYIEVSGCGFHVKETIRDIDKVLENYSGSQKRISLTRNMQPLLCFKFDLELVYNPVLRALPVPKNLYPMDKLIVLYIKTTPDHTKKILVGDSQYIYQEYAPSDTLTPVLVGTTTPYLAGKNILLLTFDNTNDLLANWSISTGTYDRTGQGNPFGFNDGDFTGIIFTDYN